MHSKVNGKEFYTLLSDEKFRTEIEGYAKSGKMNDYISKINERKNDGEIIDHI